MGVRGKGEMEHGPPRKEKKEERREGRGSRVVVDITALIHLSDSLPNAPLGKTQRCVTSNAANAAKRIPICIYTQMKT